MAGSDLCGQHIGEGGRQGNSLQVYGNYPEEKNLDQGRGTSGVNLWDSAYNIF